MLLDADDSQLVLVDYQTRLMPAMHEAPLVVANALRLVKMAHALEVPVIATAQNPDRLGGQMPELQTALDAAGARHLAKMHFSAVPDGLAPLLRPPQRKPSGNARSLPRHLQKADQPQEGRSAVVLAGCEAHVCLCRLRWICCRRNLRSGWSPMPAARDLSAIAMRPSIAWPLPVLNW